MSFCSYEEAWGSPYQGSNETETPNDNNAVDLAIETNKTPSDETQKPLIQEAPLRGSLLGGAINDEAWKTNEVEKPILNERDLGDIIAAKIDSKFDSLLLKLDKYINAIHSKFTLGSTSETGWPDVIIFITIGVITIIMLHMFFKFGKWLIKSKLYNNLQSTQLNNSMRNSMGGFGPMGNIAHMGNLRDATGNMNMFPNMQQMHMNSFLQKSGLNNMTPF
tara:strand:- start:13961 stop:14620 length:660 start_codon:yes stop_codon:yes gene_type:complete